MLPLTDARSIPTDPPAPPLSVRPRPEALRRRSGGGWAARRSHRSCAATLRPRARRSADTHAATLRRDNAVTSPTHRLDVAGKLGLSRATQDAIRALDEHCDGAGLPYSRRGDQIPLLGQIAGLAQTVEGMQGWPGGEGDRRQETGGGRRELSAVPVSCLLSPM